MSKRISIVLGPALFVAMATAAGAQQQPKADQKIDLGKTEYEFKCAACHGLAGNGDGPAAVYLTPKPSDLTTLTKDNNGVFPVARMYDVIDGSQQVAGHGTRDMPIWGREYRLEAGEHYFEGPPYSPAAYIRLRILALIEYIYRLQAK